MRSLLGPDSRATTQVIAAACGLFAVGAPARPAHAGCNDGACGRVDWTEVTDTRQGEAVSVKFHGGYAWEASPDFWSTHPMGGTVEGFVWVTCLSANGSVDSGCVPLLAQSLASEGTSTPLMFSGSYYDVNAKEVLQPPGLFSADASAQPVFYATVGLGSHGPFNPNVCPAAFALGRDGDAGGIVPNIPGSDAGVAMAPGHEQPSADAGAAPSPPQAPAGSASSTPHGSTRSSDSADASTADPRGAAGNRSPNRGCSISDRRRQATPTLPAFAFALGWTLVARSRIRMRRRCKG